jgi:ribonuclease Z
MPELIVLGTSNAIASEEHRHTHLALAGERCFVLIDCGENPIARLENIGLNPLEISDLILTHFHPDHVAAVPQFLMSSWLLGRRRPLNVHGLAHTLDRIEKTMQFYDWDTWPDFYPVRFNRLPEAEMSTVLENEEMRIFASPVRHLIPTIGLRAEFPDSSKALAYSCDTEPCQQVVRLGQRVDVLIHEATGDMPGHTSAAQAGEIARQARAAELYLIHYRVWKYDPTPLAAQAGRSFGKPVRLCEDLMHFEF